MTDNVPANAQPRPRPPDRYSAPVLLLASAATLGLLITAMVRENFLADWRVHQKTYAGMLLGSEDPRQRELGERFEVRLRQVDLPRMGTTDRCVSCHVGIDNPAMADAEQPYRTHPGDYLAEHPVAGYGCTICHRGQGPATNFYEAKAVEAHWDYPLLPAELTESSCGVCHGPDSELMRRNAPTLARGRQLFVDRGCQSCHKLDGVGGQLGPALDGEGLKTRHVLPMVNVTGETTLANWLAQHFDHPQRIVAGSRMPPPRLTRPENRALTTYMLSLQDRDLPQTYLAPDKVAQWNERLHSPVLDGQALYDGFCVNCHGDGRFGQWHKFYNQFTPAVRGPGLRAQADEQFVRVSVVLGRPGTLMPAWGQAGGGLSDAQVESLVRLLREDDSKERPVQPLRPVPDPLTGGDPARGGELFAQHCTGCHGPGGRGAIAPALANPDFQKTASDELIARAIVNGRADTAMPAFQRPGGAGLSDQEVRDVTAFVRTLGRK